MWPYQNWRFSFGSSSLGGGFVKSAMSVPPFNLGGDHGTILTPWEDGVYWLLTYQYIDCPFLWLYKQT